MLFRNLLDNAIKYTLPGGVITWEISAHALGSEHIIQDTGQGIPAFHLPHVFEHFYRADKARSRDIPGTGLGLSLVQSIVLAYGGTIQVESEGIDKGTKVRVYLPAHPLPAPTGTIQAHVSSLSRPASPVDEEES